MRTAAPIRFLLNGEPREVRGVPTTTTVLEHLRRTERLTGTKEGCAEGDCGACTVLLAEPDGAGGLRRRAVNACILFMPALDGRAVETIEHLGRDGLHPLQAAMIRRNASQCGFCTPGFVVQLHAAWLNGLLVDRQAVKDAISGNLCRCTGYGPIVDAGLDLAETALTLDEAEDRSVAARLGSLEPENGLFRYEADGGLWLSPRTEDELAAVYADHPDAVLVAGATDIGLWVTKRHQALPVLIDVTRVATLRTVAAEADRLVLGAAVTHAEAHGALADLHADLGALMRRFAGRQVRNAGTVGGNIANGSPIGDLAPALIALGATLHLRCGDTVRALPLEHFFIAYGRQDRRPGEFVRALEVPRLAGGDRFFCRKLSKRFDSDISAVMAALRLRVEGGVVRAARLAFGGMAGTPSRAPAAEAALLGRPFGEAAALEAGAALARDFTPLTDMRASAAYRLKAAQNLLLRFALEADGSAPRLEDVA